MGHTAREGDVSLEEVDCPGSVELDEVRVWEVRSRSGGRLASRGVEFVNTNRTETERKVSKMETAYILQMVKIPELSKAEVRLKSIGRDNRRTVKAALSDLAAIRPQSMNV